ncbi:MAG: hypothetical protein HY033_01355 [Ignavibacteriae bacterium]|nr:hypothetical protein [Ignavibacteria bacterium]MBI3363533.1 hypothetical protein [Ignavibacteriota bacterium]
MSSQGFLLVIDGPSAVGKSTIVRALLQQNDVPLELAKRCTTRLQRSSDDDEDIYDFISHEEYRRMKNEGAFIEQKCYKFGMCYALPKENVLKRLAGGQHVLAMINLGNIERVREVVSNTYGIFLSASLETIRHRLMGRKSHPDEQITERLGNAAESLKFMPLYDLVIQNENRNVEEVVHEILEQFQSHTRRKTAATSVPPRGGRLV